MRHMETHEKTYATTRTSQTSPHRSDGLSRSHLSHICVTQIFLQQKKKKNINRFCFTVPNFFCMTSLPSCLSVVSGTLSVSPLLPRDCVQYVTQFTDTTTTLSMFLVCRGWYHAVDRSLWLCDTFYHLPEMYGDDITRRRKIPPCNYSSVSTLKDDDRWGYVDVMVLKVQDTLEGECFPPTLKSLYLRESYRITDACVAHMSRLTSLTSLDLSY
eukprot:PhF_6_TR32153/c3_g1_i3/m.47676